MKSYIKNVAKQLLLYLMIGLSFAMLATILLFLSYRLPISPMKSNVQKSINYFEQYGTGHYIYWNSNPSFYVDDYSEATMLSTSICDEGLGAVKNSMSNSHYSYDETNIVNSLIKYIHGEPNEQFQAYSRYWNGYVIFLKPLLLVMKYQTIKIVSTVILIFLMVWLLVKMRKTPAKSYISAFLLGVYFLNPLTIFSCMEYMVVFSIIISSMITILFLYDHAYSPRNIGIVFLAIGILTCFLDYLTYPIASLCFPLILILILNCANNCSIIGIIESILYCGISWCLGYVGIWACKWGIGSVILKRNVLQEAIDFVRFRSSATAIDGVSDISRIETLKINLDVYNNTIYLIPSLLFLVLILLISLIEKEKKKTNYRYIIGASLIIMIPFIWILFTSNHAYIHYWMTHREFAVIPFALGIIVIELFRGIISKCVQNKDSQ